ncbi:serine/threonine-protein kinase [Streptomyces sp. NPDC005065]|uniref:serine/threonine-protein kinase n=1 Tax=unclassified Streptomyces TaxID=2593676 RepID=UPI0033B90D6B
MAKLASPWKVRQHPPEERCWTLSEELVAVKVLLSGVAVDPNVRAGFLRELETTHALRHRNIVGFRGGGASDRQLFLTCEYCAGGGVDELVARRGGRLPVDEAVPITLQALAGLEYAHTAPVPARLADGSVVTASGLVHRDVKPHNLLLDADGTVKVADFGLAKAFEKAGLSGYTRTGAVAGSVAFMPRPQLIDYRNTLPAVDVWAAAASLYWMLTGAAPRDFPRPPTRWPWCCASPRSASATGFPPCPADWRTSSTPPWSTGRAWSSRQPRSWPTR